MDRVCGIFFIGSASKSIYFVSEEYFGKYHKPAWIRLFEIYHWITRIYSTSTKCFSLIVLMEYEFRFEVILSTFNMFVLLLYWIEHFSTFNWLFPGKYSNKTVRKQKRKHFINDFTLFKQQSNFPLADAMYSPVVLTHAPFRKDKVRVTLVCIASVLITKFVCTFTCFMFRVRI